MGVPFQVPPEGMEHANKARDKGFGNVQFVEHAKDDTADRGKKAVEQRPVFQEERAKLLRDGKNAVAVVTVDKFKGHGGSAVDRVHVPASRAKAAMAAERDEFKLPAGAGIHGSPKGRVPAINHLVNIFNNGLAGM